MLGASSTVDDVAEWLTNMKPSLAAYVEAARALQLDGAKLLSMDPQTLVDQLAVKSMGHKIILKKELTGIQAQAQAQTQAQVDGPGQGDAAEAAAPAPVQEMGGAVKPSEEAAEKEKEETMSQPQPQQQQQQQKEVESSESGEEEEESGEEEDLYSSSSDEEEEPTGGKAYSLKDQFTTRTLEVKVPQKMEGDEGQSQQQQQQQQPEEEEEEADFLEDEPELPTKPSMDEEALTQALAAALGKKHAHALGAPASSSAAASSSSSSSANQTFIDTLLVGPAEGTVREYLAATLSPTLLQTPDATRPWSVLKEGFLLAARKTKGSMSLTEVIAKKKLFYFVLKQNPETLEVRLEQYQGMSFHDFIQLENTHIIPDKHSSKLIIDKSDSRLLLEAEKKSEKVGKSWTLALQQAALAQKTKKRLVPPEAKLKTFEMEQMEEILRTKSQQLSNDGAEILESFKQQNSNSGSATDLKPAAASADAPATPTAQDGGGEQKYQTTQRDALMKTTFLSDLASRYKFIGDT